MHQHAYLMADVLHHERHLRIDRSLQLHRHLGDGVRPASVRHHLARLLVRLARLLEPGVAGGGRLAPAIAR